MNYLNRNSTTMTIASFYELHQLGKINYNPKCQRKSIWGIEEKSFLIDTILKNFPIPPIFLHQGIDVDSGTTKFSVVDGKQRLLAIISFIEGEVGIPEDFGEGIFGDDNLNGLTFKQLKVDDLLVEYRKLFWRYQLPVEYIDTEDEKIVDNIFDRLNRNGIPLKEQELRNAQYHSEKLYKFIEKLADTEYWKKTLVSIVDTKRMLDIEFISELLFLMLEEDVFDSDPSSINDLYKKYITVFDAYSTEDIKAIETKFLELTKIIESLDLNLEKFRINKVSHLYGLWSLVYYFLTNSKDIANYSSKLKIFYEELRNASGNDGNVELYKKSTSSHTKSKNQRRRRLDSLINYIGI